MYVLYPSFFSSLGEGKFLAFLYNDEIHSYDEVIHTLTHNIKLQHSDAVALATFVDRKVHVPPSPFSVFFFFCTLSFSLCFIIILLITGSSCD